MDMKTFKTHLANTQRKTILEQVAVSASEVESDATKAVERLNKELSKLLGKQYVVKAVFSKSLGKSIHLRVHDIEPVNNIAHNSPVFMQFIMHLSSSFGKSIDLQKVSFEMSQGPRSISFRKITSKKSIDDATSKLIEWFRKNQKSLDSLLKGDK